jgi:hypothetical protein
MHRAFIANAVFRRSNSSRKHHSHATTGTHWNKGDCTSVHAYNLPDNSETESSSGRALYCLAKSLKNKVSLCRRNSRAFVRDLHHNGIVAAIGANSGSQRHCDATAAMKERVLK